MNKRIKELEDSELALMRQVIELQSEIIRLQGKIPKRLSGVDSVIRSDMLSPSCLVFS